MLRHGHEAECHEYGELDRVLKFADIPGIKAVLGHKGSLRWRSRRAEESFRELTGGVRESTLPHQVSTIVSTTALNPKRKTKRKTRVADRFGRAGVLRTGKEGGRVSLNGHDARSIFFARGSQRIAGIKCCASLFWKDERRRTEVKASRWCEESEQRPR